MNRKRFVRGSLLFAGAPNGDYFAAYVHQDHISDSMGECFMVPKVFNLGDLVEMKKPHPCGSKIWKVLRTGADIRIECQGCHHQVMLPRSKFEKNMKKTVEPTA